MRQLNLHFEGAADIWTVASLGFTLLHAPPINALAPTSGALSDNGTHRAHSAGNVSRRSDGSAAKRSTQRGTATFSLTDQTQHKIAVLHHLVLPRIDLPVLLLGHSIGFHMALRAVRVIEAEDDTFAQRCALACQHVVRTCLHVIKSRRKSPV